VDEFTTVVNVMVPVKFAVVPNFTRDPVMVRAVRYETLAAEVVTVKELFATDSVKPGALLAVLKLAFPA
jgi:hypothetical protein